MEIKNVIALLLLLISYLGKAQDDFSKEKTLRATATISQGLLFEGGPLNIYLHGVLEYFPEEKVALRGDSYFSFKTSGNSRLLNKNHSVLFGIMYYLNKNKIAAPFMGIQTGVNLVELNDPASYMETYNIPVLKIKPTITTVPVFAFRAGETIFVSKYFNFFMEFLYIKGKLNKNTYQPVKIDELRLSFGLGFHI